MRIVYLAASSIPSKTANSIQVMRMCEALAQNGHEVTLIGRLSGGESVRDIYEYYGVRKNFELSLLTGRKIKGAAILLLPKLYSRLRRYDPNKVLIYARDIYGVSLAVRMGFRAIYEAHAAPYNGLIRRLEAALFRNPRLVRLVVISDALKNFYASRFAVGDKTVVCHDAAVIPEESSNGDIPWPSCRSTLQIGYTGHLYKGRGVEIIVECAKRLPQHDFHVVGGSEADIASWRNASPANVCWHGFVEPSLVHHARARCDVLLMPYQPVIVNPHSHLNTVPWMSPMKLFEYMASRRAIIASDLPVLREVLNERMALLVAPDDPEQWANAIRQCEDQAFRQTLATNAYETFLDHYTWDKRAQKTIGGIEV
jgi:glycosyltransferase involved in cell wall biosynthesis